MLSERGQAVFAAGTAEAIRILFIYVITCTRNFILKLIKIYMILYINAHTNTEWKMHAHINKILR